MIARSPSDNAGASNESDISAIRMWGYSPDFKAKRRTTENM